jgi:hypothetical protein
MSTLLREKKTLGMRHWFKFLLPYLNANISNTTTIDNNGRVNNLTRLYFLGRKNHHRHNSTLNSTQKSLFKNFFNLKSPLLSKLLNVSLSNRTESAIQNKIGNNVRLPNETNETRVFLFRRPVMNTFIFKILDFNNEQTVDDANNRTNVSSIINSDNSKVKFLYQQNSRRQNFTINSNFNSNNNNNNNGQVEIVFKLKSILKDIFKF